MLENIFSPFSDWGLVILRLAMGITFLVHGWPKLNPNGPIKGPAGFAGFLKQMGVPLPMFFAWVVALLETVGAVLLILGLGTRILAVGFAIGMLVAILVAKIRCVIRGMPITDSGACRSLIPGHADHSIRACRSPEAG